jgi:hypothetical protein
LISHKCSCGKELQVPFEVTVPDTLVLKESTKGVHIKENKKEDIDTIPPHWVKGSKHRRK